MSTVPSLPPFRPKKYHKLCVGQLRGVYNGAEGANCVECELSKEHRNCTKEIAAVAL